MRFQLWTFLCLFWLNVPLAFTQPEVQYFERVTDFYQEFVQDGKLNYEALQANPKSLQILQPTIETFGVKYLRHDVKAAFLANTYNLLVIKTILEGYPNVQGRQLQMSLAKKRFVIGGKNRQLRQLKQELIFGHSDPRWYFALADGNLLGAPLPDSAYTEENMERLLDQQVFRLFNDSLHIHIVPETRQIVLSPLLSGYLQEVKGDHFAFRSLINQYRTTSLPMGFEFTHGSYVWHLNDVSQNMDSLNLSQSSGAESFSSVQPSMMGESTNIQAYTPAKVLEKGIFSASLDQQLQASSRIYTEDGIPFDLPSGQGFSANRLSVKAGLTTHPRLEVGLSFESQKHTFGLDSTQSVFSSLKNYPDSLGIMQENHRFIGPLIRIVPFKNMPHFSIGSRIALPLGGNDSIPTQLNPGQQWHHQLFYDFLMGRFQLYMETGLQYERKTLSDSTMGIAQMSFPTGFTFVFSPNTKLMVQGNLGYRYQFRQESWFLESEELNSTPQQLTGGLGVRYQLTEKIDVHLMTRQTLAGVSAPVQANWQLQLRMIL
ncbi:MAG: DUF547 domain-containing protein [Bacteroidota bacterium]